MGGSVSALQSLSISDIITVDRQKDEPQKSDETKGCPDFIRTRPIDFGTFELLAVAIE